MRLVGGEAGWCRLHLRHLLLGGEPAKERFLRNPLWGQLEAVKAGNVQDVRDEIWMTSVSVQGAHQVLDDLAETFDVETTRS